MTENGSRGAKRCLFGREDHSKLTEELDKQVKKDEKAQADEFARKWNFQVETETPLPGRYVWEKIERTSSSDDDGPSTSVSHLPGSDSLSESDTADPVVIAKVENPKQKKPDSSLSSCEEPGYSSPGSSQEGDKSISYSSDEKDLNQNVVQASTKRKAPSAITREDEAIKDAKRVKPP